MGGGQKEAQKPLPPPAEPPYAPPAAPAKVASTTSNTTNATVIGPDTPGAQATTLVITAPGKPEDYDAAAIEKSTAADLGVNPLEVKVTITAARRLQEYGRRLQTSSVLITITVYTADATAATAMEGKLTKMAGSKDSASTFLSKALGKTIVIDVDPAKPSSGKAEATEPAAPSAAPPPAAEGMGAGGIIGIIAGVLVVGIGGAVVVMKLKANQKVTAA